MNEAPKKMWVSDFLIDTEALDEPIKVDNPYIRADIVDGLLEALQSIAREPREQSLEYGAKSLRDKARAAIKKATGVDDGF